MINKKHRKQVAKYMRRLYKQGLTSCSGGNISLRDSHGNIYITASQSDKSIIKWNKIAVINEDGENLTTDLKPSMEYGMHLEIYKLRPEINAIVHAHPVYVSVFAVSDLNIDSGITGEARYILGEVKTIQYSLMGTPDLAKKCVSGLKDSHAAILVNHGAICIGKDLFEAFDRMEVLEFTAKIYYKSILIGKCKPLTKSQLQEIDKLKY
jgi:L-fuculose-phosphate aldolase